jgi:hypothetical protein
LDWQFLSSEIERDHFLLLWALDYGQEDQNVQIFDVRKPGVESSPQRSEELRLYNLGLEFDNSKPRLKSGIFKCISWLDGFFFGG